jgi:hypothetical protein
MNAEYRFLREPEFHAKVVLLERSILGVVEMADLDYAALRQPIGTLHEFRQARVRRAILRWIDEPAIDGLIPNPASL